METMDELMLHFLQDIYDAEKRGVRSMQKMARAASDPHLKEGILAHRDQSQQQVSRLERVFELVTGKRPRGKACAAMEGLTDEVDEAIEEGKKGPVLDAALIAGAQAIEHYEMARYGAMVAWARQAGKREAADLLQQTLDEEKHNDQLLTELAESMTNPAAADHEEEDEHHEPPPKRAASRRVVKAPARPGRMPPMTKPAATPGRAARK